MGVAPEPEMDQRLAEFGCDLLGGDQTAPGSAAAKARRLVVPQTPAHERPEPVGGKKCQAPLVGEAAAAAGRDGHAVAVGDEILDMHAEFEDDIETAGDRTRECCLQVAAVDHPIGGAV